MAVELKQGLEDHYRKRREALEQEQAEMTRRTDRLQRQLRARIRRPDRVRYVGQTVTPLLRYAQHLAEPAKSSGPRAIVNRKAAWVAQLREHGRSPAMVLLETVRVGRDMNARERHWIRTLRGIGQADLNAAAVAADAEEPTRG